MPPDVIPRPPEQAQFRISYFFVASLACLQVYFPELLAPLLRALIQVTGIQCQDTCRINSPRVIISYKIRSLAKESSFWSAFGLWFSFYPVLVQSLPHATHSHGTGLDTAETSTASIGVLAPPHSWTQYGSENGNDQYIFVAARRPESFGWDVPSLDVDLLAGVGAWGTSACKSDDTFESLLLMGLDFE